MVIVQGVFRVDPAERAAFVDQRLETMRASRDETGNLEYVIAADPLEPDRVVLSERWASMADLQAHMAGLAQRRSSSPGGVAPRSQEITVYEATEVKLR